MVPDGVVAMIDSINGLLEFLNAGQLVVSQFYSLHCSETSFTSEIF